MLDFRDSLIGQVALITGASSGLGEHFAQLLAKAGAKVIVAARRADRLAALVEEIKANGGEAFPVSMDVTSADSVDKAISQASEVFGPISILINNAGVSGSKQFIHVDEESWQQVIDTNLNGAWRVANKISRHMLEHQVKGSIVNIASILGQRVGFGESSYAASKAAVIQLTKAMSLELIRKNIRVNALCPGYFETEMNQNFFATEKGQTYLKTIPTQRLGKLYELDAPLLLLCSDAGSFVNGVALAVDGGHLNSSL